MKKRIDAYIDRRIDKRFHALLETAFLKALKKIKEEDTGASKTHRDIVDEKIVTGTLLRERMEKILNSCLDQAAY